MVNEEALIELEIILLTIIVTYHRDQLVKEWQPQQTWPPIFCVTLNKYAHLSSMAPSTNMATNLPWHPQQIWPPIFYGTLNKYGHKSSVAPSTNMATYLPLHPQQIWPPVFHGTLNKYGYLFFIAPSTNMATNHPCPSTNMATNRPWPPSTNMATIWPALSGHWLSCTGYWHYLLCMKWLMYGILLLHLSTFLGCLIYIFTFWKQNLTNDHGPPLYQIHILN